MEQNSTWILPSYCYISYTEENNPLISTLSFHSANMLFPFGFYKHKLSADADSCLNVLYVF